MRGVKKGSGIYEFLQKTGLLENGTAEEIVNAKKAYWALKRKQWKQNHRDNYISYTIFFSDKELRLLQQTANLKKISINKIIKQSCLQSLTSEAIVDKRIVGKIRESLALLYSELEKELLYKEKNLKNGTVLLKSFMNTENEILSLLKL